MRTVHIPHAWWVSCIHILFIHDPTPLLTRLVEYFSHARTTNGAYSFTDGHAQGGQCATPRGSGIVYIISYPFEPTHTFTCNAYSPPLVLCQPAVSRTLPSESPRQLKRSHGPHNNMPMLKTTVIKVLCIRKSNNKGTTVKKTYMCILSRISIAYIQLHISAVYVQCHTRQRFVRHRVCKYNGHEFESISIDF